MNFDFKTAMAYIKANKMYIIVAIVAVLVLANVAGCI